MYLEFVKLCMIGSVSLYVVPSRADITMAEVHSLQIRNIIPFRTTAPESVESNVGYAWHFSHLC